MFDKAISAVIYARFSSSNQREESIEGQLRVCHDYAKRHNMTVVGEYIDRAVSGTTDNRRDFQRLMNDAPKGNFSIVLVWKLDRFARNRYDSAMYKAKLKQAGVHIESVMEAVPEGPEGIILESLMEGLAEYYSANLSQNVKRGLYESALKRQTLGVKIYGLQKAVDGTYELDPERAPIVNRIFTEYASGIPAAVICEKLNAEGHRMLSGKPFGKDFVRRTVHNPKYKGVYQYEDIYYENGVPAIVTPELWEECQVMSKIHEQSPALKTCEGGYLLTGKLFCGHCGTAMTGDSGTSSTGMTYRYYTCDERRHHRCDKKRVRKEQIEETVLDIVRSVIMSDEFVTRFAENYEEWKQSKSLDMESPLASLEKRQKEVESEISNLISAIAKGVDPAILNGRINELTTLKKDIECGIAEIRMQKPDLTKDDVEWLLKSYRSGFTNSEVWNNIAIKKFLKAVYLFDDGRIKLVLGVDSDSEESENITLEYLEKDGEREFISVLDSSCDPSQQKSLICLPDKLGFFE